MASPRFTPTTPADLYTPTYTVLRRSAPKDYEIRSYEPFTVIKRRMDAGGTGTAFSSLAGYIFGANKQQKKMAITTPVFSLADAKVRARSLLG